MIKYEREGDTVTLHFQSDFNLLTARHLWQVVQGAEHVCVDLSHARLVDTEAIAALWELQDNGVHVTLYDPPALFQDLVAALDLEDFFEVEAAEG